MTILLTLAIILLVFIAIPLLLGSMIHNTNPEYDQQLLVDALNKQRLTEDE